MKVIAIFYCLLLATTYTLDCRAQTITAAEYFFDVDPGQGNGTSITIPTPAVQLTLAASISIASLQPGYHILFVRTRDSNMNWSLFELQQFVIEEPITGEYFFDVDPGQGNGTPLTTASQPTLNEIISIASVQPGYHILFVRTRDPSLNWSLFEPQEFVIEAPMTRVEYFFDVDPGFGNGIPLTIAPGQLSLTQDIATSSLSDGEHILFMRTLHEGQWSMFNPVAFYIFTRIVEAEYFIDLDPGFGGGAPFTVSSPSGQITITPTLNVGPLANGDHYLLVRTKDILGVWSFFEPVLFTVDNALPIELIDFTARATSDGRVNLKWTTLSEINNDFFSVQHSTDGYEFTEFATVKGAGTSNVKQEYTQVHNTPAQGMNYYRLKQVDLDGHFMFSNVVAVTIMGGGSLTVFPNPASDEWFIDFSKTETTEVWRIELFDLTGRKCLEATAETGNKTSFKRGDLASGMYLLQISSPDGSGVTMKMIFL